MDKKTNKPILIFLFFYLALFPFGQLPRLIFDFLKLPFPLHLTDLVIFSFIFYFFLREDWKKLIAKNKKSLLFVLVAAFAWAVNAAILGSESFVGVIYLFRLASYFLFFLVLKEEKLIKAQKTFLEQALIGIGTLIAIFGLVQYLFLPDMRALYTIGWDDHYYRLVSTFLDPAFTGILLVFSLLLITDRFLATKRRALLILVALNAVALALTYSRASYIALIVGLGLILVRKVPFKILLLGFFISIFLLPRPGGEGVNLLRTNSIFAKIENYNESLAIIRKSPLLGVGYNNLCVVGGVTESHACSGLDNSLLFIFASTGILGLIAFFALATKIKTRDRVFIGSCIALLVHMQFTNTLFYPWVWGWMGVLWRISHRDRHLG